MTPKMLLGFTTDDGSRVEMGLDVLKRHMLALGSSGSGKTALLKVCIEECVRLGIPAILVDPQGDLAPLGLRGSDPEADPTIANDYFSKVDVKIWTPASKAGIPVSLAPTINVVGMTDDEEKIKVFGDVSNVVASLAGYDVQKDDGLTAALAFFNILEYADKFDLICDTLADFVLFLSDPPQELAETLDRFFDKKARASAAKKLLVRTSGPSKLLFELGNAINVDALLGRDSCSGKVRVSVIYLNTLSTDAEKEAFIAVLANAVYGWMLQHPSPNLQAMFYIDEVAPYCPPQNKKRPVCKEPLMKLLRQARKYGVGCLLGTQSSGDLDYQGMGQLGTWAIGCIKPEQDRAKVEAAIRGDDTIEDPDALIRALPNLAEGQFVLSSKAVSSEPILFKSRRLVSQHRTLQASEVKSITSNADRHQYGGV